MSDGPGWRAQQKEQRFSWQDTAYLKAIENKASLPGSKHGSLELAVAEVTMGIVLPRIQRGKGSNGQDC